MADTGAYGSVKEGNRNILPMKYADLMGQILSRENMLMAHAHVQYNGGAAGSDGMTLKELPDWPSANWGDVKRRLLDGSYRPSPVRGVEIPKPDGGVRLLGIPTVLDRLIQHAVHQVLSPIWEAGFSPYSYGFRPGRSAHGALGQALAYINGGHQDVVDLDLKKFFDRVGHDKLMALVRAKVSDRALLRPIRRYLQSGIMLGGAVRPRAEGTPQGGPPSPLLSNILLDELDRELEGRGHRFVRYADDVSIFLRSKQAARRVRASITNWLRRKLHLEVNGQKTSVCRPVHFFLLGHGFVPTYKKGDRGKYNLRIAPKSWERLKVKVKAITRKTSPVTFGGRIDRLNSLMRGWVQYFKHAVGYQKFKGLDSWVRCRLRYCIWKQWKKPWRRYRAFLQLGIVPDWAKRFAWSRKGGWAVACSPIMGTTVTEARLGQKGYMPFLEYYLSVKYKGVQRTAVYRPVRTVV